MHSDGRIRKEKLHPAVPNLLGVNFDTVVRAAERNANRESMHCLTPLPFNKWQNHPKIQTLDANARAGDYFVKTTRSDTSPPCYNSLSRSKNPANWLRG